MDDSTKQALLSQFSAWLDEAGEADMPEAPEERTDLYSLFVEMAGLRGEVRTESRLVKDALDQFRAVFESLQSAQAGLQQDLDRARAESRDSARAAVRPLLLDMLDVRDRLLSGLRGSAPRTPTWRDRVFGRAASQEGAWQEGLQLTLRRLDQMLTDRNVIAMRLQGEAFDPFRARVVATVADAMAPEGIVIEESRAGFLWDNDILRTADVVVNKHAYGTGVTA